jgi:hypothetical protein
VPSLAAHARPRPPPAAPHPPCRLQGAAFSPWEDALADLPKLAVAAGAGQLRAALERLPPFPLDELLPGWERLVGPGSSYACGGGSNGGGGGGGVQGAPIAGGAVAAGAAGSGDPRLWRAYLLLSFLAHGYLWCDGPGTPQALPAALAAPWAAVAAALGMPPVLVYATYNLLNWRRLERAGPVALGNIACQHVRARGGGGGRGRAALGVGKGAPSSCCAPAPARPSTHRARHPTTPPPHHPTTRPQNFLGGVDEEWFRLVHVSIEAAAGPAVAALEPLQRAAREVGGGR